MCFFSLNLVFLNKKICFSNTYVHTRIFPQLDAYFPRPWAARTPCPAATVCPAPTCNDSSTLLLLLLLLSSLKTFKCK